MSGFKKRTPKMRKKKGLFIVCVIIAALVAGSGCYVGNYYHAENPTEALADTDTVQVVETSTGYLFDGPGENRALIFYPGAKVEDIAYANLLKNLAADGTDCFLVHMPGNMAMFGIQRADKIQEEYPSYEHWYLAGHSLGGAIGAIYISKHADQYDGMIFLAAYSTKDLTNTGLKILTLRGSEDQVCIEAHLDKYRSNLPSDAVEYIIDGGNHAQYGDYGVQKGDGTATISAAEQQTIAVEQIESIVSTY